MAGTNGYQGLIDWLCFLLTGLWVLLWVISRRSFRLGAVEVRLSKADAARLGFAVVVPGWIACAAAHYILVANTAYWQAGDWRSSWQLVALNMFLIVAVAPAISLAGFISLWLSHRRRK
jgi:hypothetical protein